MSNPLPNNITSNRLKRTQGYNKKNVQKRRSKANKKKAKTVVKWNRKRRTDRTLWCDQILQGTIIIFSQYMSRRRFFIWWSSSIIARISQMGFRPPDAPSLSSLDGENGFWNAHRWMPYICMHNVDACTTVSLARSAAVAGIRWTRPVINQTGDIYAFGRVMSC